MDHYTAERFRIARYLARRPYFTLALVATGAFWGYLFIAMGVPA